MAIFNLRLFFLIYLAVLLLPGRYASRFQPGNLQINWTTTPIIQPAFADKRGGFEQKNTDNTCSPVTFVHATTKRKKEKEKPLNR